MYYLIIILFLFLFAILGHFIKKKKKKYNVENFMINTFHNHYVDIYDNFYSSIYNELFLSELKNEYEINNIKNYALNKFKGPINVLDVGCGTGNHLKILKKHGYKCTGLDISKNMVNIAKKNNPTCIIKQGDYHKKLLFKKREFSHIQCLFFTLYYSNDQKSVIKNFNYWLKPKGYLILHLIDPKNFDPVLEKSSRLIPLYNPQKDKKNRKTKSKLTFNKFKYISDWKFDNENIEFIENLYFSDGSKHIKNIHKFTIYSIKYYIKLLNNEGFKLEKIIDLALANHEYNYIYIFKKIYG